MTAWGASDSIVSFFKTKRNTLREEQTGIFHYQLGFIAFSLYKTLTWFSFTPNPATIGSKFLSVEHSMGGSITSHQGFSTNRCQAGVPLSPYKVLPNLVPRLQHSALGCSALPSSTLDLPL